MIVIFYYEILSATLKPKLSNIPPKYVVEMQKLSM